ncbi:MAG TPA: TatD family hydrolase [Bacteroidaceae bacterium]|nr:TatD family hydrolase [Bacteroidaceae bacterium]
MNKYIIDTHTHLYDEAFEQDCDEVLMSSLEAGIRYFLLPNCDQSTYLQMQNLCKKYPNVCFPMYGVHPTSLTKDNWQYELARVKEALVNDSRPIAIGEIGIDLYWSKEAVEEQQLTFRQQLQWALDYNLPVSVHCRKGFAQIIEVLDEFKGKSLTGVFHCFSEGEAQLNKVLDYGFYVGLGGVVTFKKAHIADLLPTIPEDRFVLETDAPYLAPTPKRGQRNLPEYLHYVAQFIADKTGRTKEDIIHKSTENALRLFQIDSFIGFRP